MLNENEIKLIRKKFKNFIQSNKISLPKFQKKNFFKQKAESSLALARKLLQEGEHLDWIINIAYYSMYYNAVSLLAHKNIDIDCIDENTHVLTYQALVFYYYLQDSIIEKQYIEDFRENLNDSNIRLRNIAKQKSYEIISSFKKARNKRGEITYELGKTAELKSAKTAYKRAENFDILSTKIMFKE